MLNRIMLFLIDAVCFLGICAGLSEIVHLVKPTVPSVTRFDSDWPLMHASAVKFMVPSTFAKAKE